MKNFPTFSAYRIHYRFGDVTISRCEVKVSQSRSKFVFDGKEVSFASAPHIHPKRWESVTAGAISALEIKLKNNAKRIAICRQMQTQAKDKWRKSVNAKKQREEAKRKSKK